MIDIAARLLTVIIILGPLFGLGVVVAWLLRDLLPMLTNKESE